MIVATLDTDIVFSGLYSNRGASHQILRAALSEEFTPAISVPLFLEYEAVLKRPHNLQQLGFTSESMDTFLTGLLHVAAWIERIYYLW
ncbi:MAG: PIN domain-containing protein [Candidatus Poribacteria bacterium]|nr:PIN domain-containing protein [Candidatus Poribacteria bacterium]